MQQILVKIIVEIITIPADEIDKNRAIDCKRMQLPIHILPHALCTKQSSCK